MQLHPKIGFIAWTRTAENPFNILFPSRAFNFYVLCSKMSHMLLTILRYFNSDPLFTTIDIDLQLWFKGMFQYLWWFWVLSLGGSHRCDLIKAAREGIFDWSFGQMSRLRMFKSILLIIVILAFLIMYFKFSSCLCVRRIILFEEKYFTIVAENGHSVEFGG